MADPKFGIKRICPHCEKKFYDLNKKSPFDCPCGEKEIVIEEDPIFGSSPVPQQTKQETKDEFEGIENADSAEENEDDVISLDEAAIEEEQESKN